MRLLLDSQYMPLVEGGLKSSTVRLGHRAVTLGDELILSSSASEVHAVITGAHYTTIDALTDSDAARDGFVTADELRRALRSIYYGTLRTDEPVTVIVFERKAVKA